MHIVVEWEGGRIARSFSLCDVGVDTHAYNAGEAEGQNEGRDECAEIRGSKAEEVPAEGTLVSCYVIKRPPLHLLSPDVAMLPEA